MVFNVKLKELYKKATTASQAESQSSTLCELKKLVSECMELKDQSFGRRDLDSSLKKEQAANGGLSSSEASFIAVVDCFNCDLFSYYSASDTPSPFILNCLKALAPIIGAERFILKWWPACLKKWIESSKNEDRHLIEELLIEYLFLEKNSEAPSECISIIIDCYSVIFSENFQADIKASKIGEFPSFSKNASSDILSKTIKKILVEFGARNPKGLFHTCAQHFKISEKRLAVSDLLLEFLFQKSDYSYELASTPLQEYLFLALLFDEAPRILDSCSSILTMLLPYQLPRNPELLPLVLAILGRLTTSLNYDHDLVKVKRKVLLGFDWEILASPGDKKFNIMPIQLFTFIYGMFPRSLISFIRHPIKFLENAQGVTVRERWNVLLDSLDLAYIDEVQLLSFGKELLSSHQIIPDILLEDLKSDLYEKSPVLLLEPSGIISYCLEKYSGHLKKNGTISDKTESLESEPYKSIVQRLTQIHLEIEMSLIEFPDSAQKLTNEDLCLLIHSMRCELYLEGFLRRHQSDYIRQFHREQLTENSSEAERHSLYSTCRALRQEVKLLKEIQERQRLESTASQSKHIKWENELNQKLKHYRELSRDLKSQISLLNSELQLLKETVALKEEMSQKTQAELSTLQYQMETLDLLSSQLQEKESQNEKLSSTLLKWDSQKMEIPEEANVALSLDP